MEKDSPVFESERFQDSDLRFFLRGDTVHRRHHGQYRDGEEQYGQDRAHRFAFGRFTHRFFVNDVIVLRDDHQRSAEFFPDGVFKVLFPET